MTSPIRSASESTRRHDAFLSMIPIIERYASFRFRQLPTEARDDAVQEVLANCFVAYARLIERGREKTVSATPLGRYAVRQYFAGRRVGTPLNVRDAMSPRCHARKGVSVQRLHSWDEQDQQWREMLVEDRRATPADLAASRIDFPAWLKTLSHRDRRIALRLAEGETPGAVARRFRLSPGRISQLRRKLAAAWQAFHGELCPEAAATASA